MQSPGSVTIMLKHLGPKADTYLTELLNPSLNDQIIPSTWKVGRVIPLSKPGKPTAFELLWTLLVDSITLGSTVRCSLSSWDICQKNF